MLKPQYCTVVFNNSTENPKGQLMEDNNNANYYYYYTY